MFSLTFTQNLKFNSSVIFASRSYSFCLLFHVSRLLSRLRRANSYLHRLYLLTAVHVARVLELSETRNDECLFCVDFENFTFSRSIFSRFFFFAHRTRIVFAKRIVTSGCKVQGIRKLRHSREYLFSICWKAFFERNRSRERNERCTFPRVRTMFVK